MAGEDVSKDVARLNAESIETKRRLDMLEENDKRHDNDIRALFAHQEGTKAYVTQILDSIKQLETKLFGLVTQLNNMASDERKVASVERTSTTVGWQATVKDIIKLTIAAVIGYLFSNGGGN